jgi:cysteine-rich repeat protein
MELWVPVVARNSLAIAWALFLVAQAAGPASAQSGVPPRNFKIAFIGDQDLGAEAEDVLNLILEEGADAVIHSGDFDYHDDPEAWDDQINRTLGANFPYFGSVGNHDDSLFSADDESGGYQQVMAARMDRLGIPWEGVLGVKSSFYYQNVFIVLTAPDIFGDGDTVYAPYIRERLGADDSIWRISSWHKNMREMQAGGKGDETGWGVYEESRAGGAIIATGHEHSYSRTHLLASCELQEVASDSDTLVLSRDDPTTPDDEGRSFVFVSGLGGRGIRNQDRSGDWWASIYTSDQNANYGALFGEFNYQGNARMAHFYFKDIDGNVPDEFFVESNLGRAASCGDDTLDPGEQCDDGNQRSGDGCSSSCLLEGPPLARLDRDCIDAMGESFTAVAKDSLKNVSSCIGQQASSKLRGSVAACFEADAKGKVAKAMAKTEAREASACGTPMPAFGVSDASTVNAVARQSGLGVVHHLLGPDLDTAIVLRKAGKRASRCQQAVVKSAVKCHDTKLAAFVRCKSSGLEHGSVQGADDLAACVSQAADRRVGKACEDQVARAIDKKCVAKDTDLSDAFPGCATDDPQALATCLRSGIGTLTCLAIGEADGLLTALPDYAQSCGSRGL